MDDNILGLLEESYGNNNVEAIMVNGEPNGVIKIEIPGSMIVNGCDDSYVSTVYVNTNELGENVNVSAYIPGSEGLTNDANLIRKYYGENAINNFNYECFKGSNNEDWRPSKSGIFSMANSSSDEGNCAEAAMDVAATINKGVSNIDINGFSDGALISVKRANQFAGNHPGVDMSLYLCDPNKANENMGIDTSNLTKNGIPIYYYTSVDENHQKRLDEFVRLFPDVNLSKIVCSMGHNEINDQILSNIMLVNKQSPFIFAYGDEIFKWTGEVFETLTPEEQAKWQAKPDVSIVKTNSETVANMLNEIRSSMQKSISNNPQKLDIQNSTVGIIGGIEKSQLAYLSINNDLQNKLKGELNAIYSIADNYYRLDQNLADMASNLKRIADSGVSYVGHNSDINSILNISFTDQITFTRDFQIEKCSGEKVGKVTVEDLNSMLSSNGIVFGNLNAEIEAANATITSIDNLRSIIGSDLISSAWEVVGVKLDAYKELEQLRIDSNLLLQNAYTAALNHIKNYMGEYTSLDTGKITEFRELVASFEAEIESTQMEMVKTKDIPINNMDKSGKIEVTYITVPYYSDGQIAAMREKVEKLKEQIIEYNKLIDRLVGLSVALNEASEMVNNAMQQVYNTYGSAVSNFVSGKPVSYSPSNKNSGIENGGGSRFSPQMESLEPIKTMEDLGLNSSNMNPDDVNRINSCIEGWPEDLSKGRIDVLRNALSLAQDTDKNTKTKYSMEDRLKGYDTDKPESLDCSSSVSWSYNKAGFSVDRNANTASYVKAENGNTNFVAIERDELIPGDIALVNKSKDGNGANHVGIYLGIDSVGNRTFIDFNKNPSRDGFGFAQNLGARDGQYRRYDGIDGEILNQHSIAINKETIMNDNPLPPPIQDIPSEQDLQLANNDPVINDITIVPAIQDIPSDDYFKQWMEANAKEREIINASYNKGVF